MSRTRAASAPSASSPSASMVMRAPLPAASIITPMMLFAFTRRPLRDSHTSEAKPLATCVSLAAARACSPSLLTISTSVRGIAEFGIQPDHAVAPAARRLPHDGGGIVVNRDAQLPDLQRPLAEHVARAVDKRLAESPVRDDQNSDHENPFCKPNEEASSEGLIVQRRRKFGKGESA